MVRLARFGPLFEDLCVHSPTLISSPPDCIHQAVIQRPRELHHDLNRTLSSSFLTSILPFFLRQRLVPSPPILACVSACVRVTSPPHRSANLSIPIDTATSMIHFGYKLRLTRAAALACMKCSIFIWIRHLDLEALDRGAKLPALSQRKDRGWFEKPWEAAKTQYQASMLKKA